MKKSIVSIVLMSCSLLSPNRDYSEIIQLTKTLQPVEYVVKKSIAIKAEPGKVWDALTNPEKTQKYFFHSRVFSNWKPGSPITFKGRIFLIKKIELNGKIIAAEPGKLLKYTLKNGKEENLDNFSTVTDVLTYSNGETTVSVSDDVGKAEGAEKRFKRSEKGWEKVLKGLKETVEENK